MGKSKYEKLEVTVAIKFRNKKETTAQKLKMKLEKVFEKKGVIIHAVSIEPFFPLPETAPFEVAKSGRKPGVLKAVNKAS